MDPLHKGSDPSLNTKNFSIWVSTDGEDWARIVDVFGNTEDVTYHNIADTTARYVRLNITAAVQSGEDVARIYEFGAYGMGGPTSTPVPTDTPEGSWNLALNRPATASRGAELADGG